MLAIAAAVALVLLLPSLTTLLTDWWWFREVGYQVVFSRVLVTRVLLFFIAGGLTAGVLYLNLRIAQRGLVANPILLQLAESAPPLNVTVALRRLSAPVTLGIGLLTGTSGNPKERRVRPSPITTTIDETGRNRPHRTGL